MDAANSASASVVRDRLTWKVYSQLAIYGYFLYAFTPSVTLLRDDEHTSRAVSGLHGTGLAVGAMLTALIAPRLIARFGRALIMWVALGLLCAGAIAFVSCDVVAVTIAGALIAGVGGTLALNIGVAVLTDHHRGPAGGAAVTQMNGLGSACGIFAPLLVGGAVSIGIGWRAGLLVTVVLAIAVAVIFGRTPKDAAEAPVHVRKIREKGPLSKEFWRACGVLVMTNAIEFSMTIWSSDVLNHHDGLSKGTAATGVTAIVTGMTIGRLSSARLTLRHGVDRLLIYAFGLTIVGFGVFWVSTNPYLAFVGLFISGLGISVQFPLSITRAVGFSDGRPDLATAYASLAGGFAVAVAPFGLGAFADHVGSHTAMLVVPAFALLAIVGVGTTKGPLAR
ncbi:MAG TPA: MFS transporter, partial [Acidothermaceae bacterium]|nr:MFS transporter [Acidothermaceae bacterium]